MTGLAVLTVLAVLESTLPSLGLSYKIQHNEATVAVLTVLAVSAVMAVSVMTATPLRLKPNPPFSVILTILEKKHSENAWANENLSCGFSSIPPIAPGVAPRIVVFALHKSWDAIPPRMGFCVKHQRFPE